MLAGGFSIVEATMSGLVGVAANAADQYFPMRKGLEPENLSAMLSWLRGLAWSFCRDWEINRFTSKIL